LAASQTVSEHITVSYRELARLFLRLSISAFGGPVAHIAMAEDEIVTRRKWLTRDHFLDLIAATNLIPGPNSTEVMIHVGYVTRGIPGAMLAGACFIGPAFLLTLALSVLYVSTGTIPEINAILWGIKPVIVAIIANAGYRLARTALKTRILWGLFVVCLLILLLTDVPEVVVMVGAGLTYILLQSGLERSSGVALVIGIRAAGQFPIRAREWLTIHSATLIPTLTLQPEAVSVSLWSVFFYFFKIGSVLFGSGYILIAYIQQDVVNTFGWLSSRQLLDAIAIGQTTPGPVLTTVAVVGYIIAGLSGAIVATLGVFLPSFILVILTAPLIPRMRKIRALGAFLSGINAGVIAAILVTLIDLFNAALKTPDGTALSPVSILTMIGALVLLIRTKVNATWLIAIGGVVGLVSPLLIH
jgi:chromate transporter